MNKKRILFVCTHNSARSQIAEGLIREFHRDRFEAESAGTEPSTLNPFAVRAMKEIGVDISAQRSKNINEFLDEKFDYVVTVCDHAQETCPFFPGGKVIHKSFKDPAQTKGSDSDIMKVFRSSRDEIKKWLEDSFNRDESFR
jgi:arsenate reductase